MLVALALVGATLWFGLIGLLRPSGGPAATMVARLPGLGVTATPPAATRSPVPATARPGAPNWPLPATASSSG